MKRFETVATSRQGGEPSLHRDDYATPLECHEEVSQKITLIIIMSVNFPFNFIAVHQWNATFSLMHVYLGPSSRKQNNAWISQSYSIDGIQFNCAREHDWRWTEVQVSH